MPLTTATFRFQLVLVVCHCSKRLSESRVLRGETTLEAIACVTEESCLQKFLSMNTGGVFYVDDFPSKGCFSKNGNGFFGTGGTEEEMAEAVLTRFQERIWCDTETALLTSIPSKPPTERTSIVSTTEVPASPPPNEPTADLTQKLLTESPSQVPTETPTFMPSSPPTAYPTEKPLTESPMTVWIESLSQVPTETLTSTPSKPPTAYPTKKPQTESPMTVGIENPSQVPTETLTSMPSKPPTAYPNKKPVTDSTTVVWVGLMHVIDSPSMDPTAKTVMDDSSGQLSAKPTQPTAKPVTGSPTTEPTPMPVTDPPTQQPTAKPTESPSFKPSEEPKSVPTAKPVTGSPTTEPTSMPVTPPPTQQPSGKPTESPSFEPSEEPTSAVTAKLTESTSFKPSQEPSSAVTAKPTESPSFKPSEEPTSAVNTTAVSISAKPTLGPSSITSASPSQFILPLPLTEHSIEMEYQAKPMTSLNNDSNIPSFAPTVRPSPSMSYNITDSVDSHLPKYDDQAVSNQLVLIGVVFIVGFLLVAIYVFKTQYGRRILRNQSNPGDDDDLEEPAAEADFPRYVEVQSNIEDQIEPPKTEPPKTEPPKTEPLETKFEEPIEDLCGIFNDWHRAMQPYPNVSSVTASVGNTTTNWNQSKQPPFDKSKSESRANAFVNDTNANWQQSPRPSPKELPADALADNASTFSSEKSSGGLSTTFSLFQSEETSKPNASTIRELEKSA